MKNILIILLLAVSFSGCAQHKEAAAGQSVKKDSVFLLHQGIDSLQKSADSMALILNGIDTKMGTLPWFKKRYLVDQQKVIALKKAIKVEQKKKNRTFFFHQVDSISTYAKYRRVAADSLSVPDKEKYLVMKKVCDSMQNIFTSIDTCTTDHKVMKKRAELEHQRVAKSVGYVKIVKSKPGDIKFFDGWIDRAVNKN